MTETASENHRLRRRRYNLTAAIIIMLYQYPLNDEDPERPVRTPACGRALELLHYEEGICEDNLIARNGLIDDCNYEHYEDYEREVDRICTPPEDISETELKDMNVLLSEEVRSLEILLFNLLADYCNSGKYVDHLFMTAGETACELLGIGDFEDFEKAAERLGFEYTPRDLTKIWPHIPSPKPVNEPRLRKGLRKKKTKVKKR